MEINGTFQIESAKDTVVVTPLIDLGELEYKRIERDGKTVLDWLEAARAKNVVVDFEKTDYYGSTALGFFVRLWKRSRGQGGRMAFCNVSRHERDILALTKLDSLWLICGTRQDALTAVGNGGDE